MSLLWIIFLAILVDALYIGTYFFFENE